MDSQQQRVQKMYDESAVLWHASRQRRSTGNSFNWPAIQTYLDQVKPGESILDAGCGDGRLVSGLPKGVSYTGFDFSRSLLTIARSTYPSYEFCYGSLTGKKMWDALHMYDRIFCIAALHHIPEREQHAFILREMKAHISPVGLLHASVWNLYQDTFQKYHEQSAELKKENDRWIEIPFAGKWKRFCFAMDIPYLESLLSETGWKIKEIFYSDRLGNTSTIELGENIVFTASL